MESSGRKQYYFDIVGYQVSEEFIIDQALLFMIGLLLWSLVVYACGPERGNRNPTPLQKKEADNENEAALRLRLVREEDATRAITKLCPGCSVRCTKDRMCNHVTCELSISKERPAGG